ncbi:MAG: cyclase family protein [Solirubrobacteraceae bacterium]|nr:cyclase family protein [Solirubrobacteraceae bacterium]
MIELLAELRSCRWVDLTHAFEPGIPHFHLFPDEQRTTLFDFDEGSGTLGHGFLAHEYRHIGQWGTHVDPPGHFVRDGRALDDIGVEEMILPLAVLDVREQVRSDPDYSVDAAFIRGYEERHGPIPAGAFVALNTGWAERWPDGDAMQNRDAAGVAHYPGWGVDALELLVEGRGITAIGHDMTDTDPGVRVSAGEYPAEVYILGADRWQIELLASLDQVPPAGALIVASWPKPRGGSGFPARVFALVPPARES